MKLWNKAAILKHLWAFSKNKDTLWIKWVQHNCFKEKNLNNMPIPKNVAWVVRKIIDKRKVILQHLESQEVLMQTLDKLLQGGKFSIRKAYMSLQTQYTKIAWKSITLHKHIHPRFNFNLWLEVNKRLGTVDIPQKNGVQVTRECAFCNKTEETFD